MILYYWDDGYLSAVYNNGGRAIAILQRTKTGVELHPEYDTDEASAAIVDVLLFDPGKVKADPVAPNWTNFRQQITTDSAYLRIVTTNAITQALNTALNGVLWRVGEDSSLMPEVAGIWNAIASSALPTVEEIEALNAIASDNNVPLQLNDLGLIG